MPPVKLSSPVYTVVLGDPSDESTWAQIADIKVLSVDLMRAEQVMHKEKVKPTDLPIRFGALGVWAALTRRGDVDAPWLDFQASLIDLDSTAPDEAGPTLPAPVAG